MNKLLLLGLSSCFALSLNAQTTIVSSISDLTLNYSGGASEAGSGVGEVSIQTSKNSDVNASLPATYQLGVGNSISATFNMALDANFANTSSFFSVSFGDGVTYYSVRLNPNQSGNSVTTFQSNGSNIGSKQAQDNTFGIANNEFIFTVTRTATSEYELSFGSATLADPAVSVTTTSILQDTFNEINFAFDGAGWNENLGSGTAVATISNFSIETDGSVIPEPSTYAMVLGAAVLTLGVMRRRKH